MDNYIAKMQACMLSRWRIRDPDLLKRWVCTSMAVLPQALKIYELLRVKKLKLISACLEDFSLKFKRSLNPLKITLFDLSDVALVFCFQGLGISIPRQR
ncbi:hypothetical protein A167_01698 [Alcanivorax sp. S71-1-4]|nr:hypothetical protein A167_01698 [Alcanivorax sp. S71-1-4]